MTDRKRQIEALIESLRHLGDILRRDPDCCWTDGIESFGYEAERLASDGCSPQDLDSLSASIRSVYGGMGSFLDYIPQANGKVLPWAHEFDRLRGEVYKHADSLRLTGDVA